MTHKKETRSGRGDAISRESNGLAEDYDVQDEYPLVPCPHCHDYPCRCLMDDDLSDPMGQVGYDGGDL